MIQDPRMLEVTKAEWFETLEIFDCDVIKETVTDVKKLAGEFPSIQKFYEIASSKAKYRKAEMEARERKESERKILEFKGDPEAAEKARDEIRKLCSLKSVNVERRSLNEDTIRKP